jgi:hypothetical protein
MTLDHKAWVIAEQSEWLVEPIDHQSFDMVPTIRNCPLTSPLPLEVRLAIPSPRNAQGGTVHPRLSAIATVNIETFVVRCFLRSRVNALCDRSQQRLRLGARFARVEFAGFTNLEADRLSLPVRTQVALHHERLCSLAHHYKEAGQLNIAHEPLARRGER